MTDDRKVVDLKVRRKDTSTQIQIVPTFGKCRHQRALLDPNLAYLECADCHEHLNPMEFIKTLATMERVAEYRQEEVAKAAKALEARSVCICTHCGRRTEIRRVGRREIKRLRGDK